MTGRIFPLAAGRHAKLKALMPWYAAGRLDEPERSGLEAHIAGCAECQGELAAERRLIAELAEPEREAAPPSLAAERGWRRVRRRMEEEQARPARPRRPVRPGRRRDAPWLGWAVAGQACLLLILGGVVWQTTQPARYHALGSAPPPAAGNLIVIFRPETSEAELRAVLVASRARLVDGPTPADAWVLRVPAAERPAALIRLRRDPHIVLAEPVDSGGPP